jgi:hypothetical protein
MADLQHLIGTNTLAAATARPMYVVTLRRRLRHAKLCTPGASIICLLCDRPKFLDDWTRLLDLGTGSAIKSRHAEATVIRDKMVRFALLYGTSCAPARAQVAAENSLSIDKTIRVMIRSGGQASGSVVRHR